MESKHETLTEACAPIFLFLTTFRRNSATSTLTIEALHATLKREIDALRDRCEKDRKLHALFEKALYPLVAAADQIVISSSWPQRSGWSMKLLEQHYFKTAEGGKKFYRILDDLLRDPSDEAAELAEFMFTCMALGFQGELLGEHRELERRRLQLFEKARLAGQIGDQITPDAYGRNAARTLAKLPTVGVMRLVVVAVAAVLFAILVGNVVTRLENSATTEAIKDLQEHLEGSAN